MKFILFVLILTIIVAIYLYIENYLLLVKRHEDQGGNIKILHLSDCHKRNNTDFNKRIVTASKEEKPDLIFITGDIVSRTETDFSETERLLTELCDIAPVYMCMGNHEQSFIHNNQQEFLDAVHRTKAELLINRGEAVKIKGREFYICGVMSEYSVYKKDGSYKNLDDFTLDDMKKNLGECPEEMVLLLAHNPLFGAVYAEWGADYTFSGHIHGGVVRLFGVGILSPERKFFPKYSKGIYDISGKKLLVSAGVGKLRMFNPPEIIIYKI
ncbi:MAG: metallophosphoesterase [Ruminococcus sp.]|nr:metallophosphoesterase [Ruminococcus sp.]